MITFKRTHGDRGFISDTFLLTRKRDVRILGEAADYTRLNMSRVSWGFVQEHPGLRTVDEKLPWIVFVEEEDYEKYLSFPDNPMLLPVGIIFL